MFLIHLDSSTLICLDSRFVKIIQRTREGVAQIEKILREKADVVCDKLNNIMGPVSRSSLFIIEHPITAYIAYIHTSGYA